MRTRTHTHTHTRTHHQVEQCWLVTRTGQQVELAPSIDELPAAQPTVQPQSADRAINTRNTGAKVGGAGVAHACNYVPLLAHGCMSACACEVGVRAINTRGPRWGVPGAGVERWGNFVLLLAHGCMSACAREVGVCVGARVSGSMQRWCWLCARMSHTCYVFDCLCMNPRCPS